MCNCLFLTLARSAHHFTFVVCLFLTFIVLVVIAAWWSWAAVRNPCWDRLSWWCAVMWWWDELNQWQGISAKYSLFYVDFPECLIVHSYTISSILQLCMLFLNSFFDTKPGTCRKLMMQLWNHIIVSHHEHNCRTRNGTTATKYTHRHVQYY